MIPKETFRIQIEVKIFKKEVLEFSFLPSTMHEWSILFKWHVAPNSLRRNKYVKHFLGERERQWRLLWPRTSLWAKPWFLICSKIKESEHYGTYKYRWRSHSFCFGLLSQWILLDPLLGRVMMTLEIFFINSTNMRIRQTCLRNLTWIVANFFQSSL